MFLLDHHNHLSDLRLEAGVKVSSGFLFDKFARLMEVPLKAALTCSDADDQKFIDLAVTHKALLLSKDKAVISLTKRLLAQGVIMRKAM